MNTTEQMQNVVTRYFELWQTQNVDGLPEIFLPEAKYVVHPFGVEEHAGIEAIQDYWKNNPVEGQINPQPSIISQAFGDNIAFVEWETVFGRHEGASKRIRGILLLEFKDGLIKELREHYDATDE